MEDRMGLKGKFHLELIGPDGKLNDVRDVDNTIMNVGKSAMSGLMLSDIGGTAFDYLALGTDSTAPNATQTALIAQVYRTASTGTQVSTSTTNDTAQLSGSFSITASNTLQEVGIFNSSSAGTMFARTTYSAINAASGDTINAVYKVQFS